MKFYQKLLAVTAVIAVGILASFQVALGTPIEQDHVPYKHMGNVMVCAHKESAVSILDAHRTGGLDTAKKLVTELRKKLECGNVIGMFLITEQSETATMLRFGKRDMVVVLVDIKLYPGERQYWGFRTYEITKDDPEKVPGTSI